VLRKLVRGGEGISVLADRGTKETERTTECMAGGGGTRVRGKDLQKKDGRADSQKRHSGAVVTIRTSRKKRGVYTRFRSGLAGEDRRSQPAGVKGGGHTNLIGHTLQAQ